jgi:hypothetical protein
MGTDTKAYLNLFVKVPVSVVVKNCSGALTSDQYSKEAPYSREPYLIVAKRRSECRLAADLDMMRMKPILRSVSNLKYVDTRRFTIMRWQ